MTTSVQITIAEETNGRLAIATPYDQQFISGIKRLGGRWDSASKVWTVAQTERKEAEVLLGEIYGWMSSGLGGTQRVTITAKETIKVHTDGVRIAGQTIARATGRDSGARLGEGVVLLDGKIESTGSMKNWYTLIKAGSRFRLEFPLLALDSIDASSWDVEYNA